MSFSFRKLSLFLALCCSRPFMLPHFWIATARTACGDTLYILLSKAQLTNGCSLLLVNLLIIGALVRDTILAKLALLELILRCFTFLLQIGASLTSLQVCRSSAVWCWYSLFASLLLITTTLSVCTCHLTVSISVGRSPACARLRYLVATPCFVRYPLTTFSSNAFIARRLECFWHS